MNTFTPNQELSNRSICDHNCIFSSTVVSRTEKTVTITDRDGKTPTRCKIHHDESGNEFIFPYGRYSMAPIFRA